MVELCYSLITWSCHCPLLFHWQEFFFRSVQRFQSSCEEPDVGEGSSLCYFLTGIEHLWRGNHETQYLSISFQFSIHTWRDTELIICTTVETKGCPWVTVCKDCYIYLRRTHTQVLISYKYTSSGEHTSLIRTHLRGSRVSILEEYKNSHCATAQYLSFWFRNQTPLSADLSW